MEIIKLAILWEYQKKSSEFTHLLFRVLQKAQQVGKYLSAVGTRPSSIHR